MDSIRNSFDVLRNDRCGGSSPTSLSISVLSILLSTSSCNLLSVFPSKWPNLGGNFPLERHCQVFRECALSEHCSVNVHSQIFFCSSSASANVYFKTYPGVPPMYIFQYFPNIYPARVRSARAVNCQPVPPQCSEVGQDFLLRRRVTLTETAVTRKRKV